MKDKYREQARKLVEAYLERADYEVDSDAETPKPRLVAEARISDPTLRSYLSTALWSSNDESTPQGGEPLERNYGIEDIADESVRQAAKDIAKFEGMAGEMLDGFRAEDIGHDFWLTRNGHGAGFWDGDYEPYGDKLTKIAKRFGELDPYVGDDGVVYIG